MSTTLTEYGQHVPGDTPIVTELREALDTAFVEAEAAVGTPAHHTLGARFHTIAGEIHRLTGDDPRQLGQRPEPVGPCHAFRPIPGGGVNLCTRPKGHRTGHLDMVHNVGWEA